jgi:hypothetical protein
VQIIFGIAHEFSFTGYLGKMIYGEPCSALQGFFHWELFSVNFLQNVANSPGGARRVRVEMSLELLCGSIPRWATLSRKGVSTNAQAERKRKAIPFRTATHTKALMRLLIGVKVKAVFKTTHPIKGLLTCRALVPVCLARG